MLLLASCTSYALNQTVSAFAERQNKTVLISKEPKDEKEA